MAGQVQKRRRLSNPGHRRMTAKQIKFFGTKRQKAALRNRAGAQKMARRFQHTGRTPQVVYKFAQHRKRKRKYLAKNQGLISSAEKATERAIDRVERAAESAISSVTGRMTNRRRRRGNVGEILTVLPANPGRRRKKKMASTRRHNRRARTANGRFRRHNRGRVHHRRHNWANRAHRRRSNPKVVVRYRNRSHHRRHSYRRRNQGAMGGKMGAVVGILGGAALTKIIVGFLPSTITTGWTGYIVTALVAVGGGRLAGNVLKNRSLGNWVTIGGLLIVGLELMGQLFPGVALPLGLSGMGLITDSNFFVPQVNLPGSMARFVTPAGIPAPVVVPASTSSGLGAMNQGLRRVGRFR